MTLKLSPQDQYARTGNMYEDLKQSEYERDLLSYLVKQVDEARQARMSEEKKWHINLAFFDGRQNVQWISPRNTGFAQLREPQAPSWRVRMIINKIRPTIRTELAKLLQEKPRGFVAPATSEEADIMAARAGDKAVEYVNYSKKVLFYMEQGAFWALTCGNGFIKHYYDPLAISDTGDEGDFVFSISTPFHLLVSDLMETELQKQAFVIEQAVKDPDWVEATYGVSLIPEDLYSSAEATQTQYLDALNLKQIQRKYVTLFEGWFKPCKKFPKGAVITFTRSRILSMTDGLPYAHGNYPWSHIGHIPSGKFYRTSVIDDLLPIQREWNRTRSQIIESKNRTSKPQIIAPLGAIDPEKITSEPGLIIEYRNGFGAKPEYMQTPPLPSYIGDELARMNSDWEDVSAQHAISNGGVPSGVTASTAIAFLQEQDDSKLSHTTRSIEWATQNIFQQVLSYIVQFWDSPRLVKIVGENTAFESFLIKSADLRGNTDYRVEQGSAIPKSRAAKQAFLMELAKMGALPFDKMLRYMDLAETGKLYEEMQLDSRQAQRENLQIVNVQPPDPMSLSFGQAPTPVGPNVNTFDNHIVHVIEHDNYRKSESFEILRPDQKQMFEDHVMTHKLQLAQMYGQNYMNPDGTVNPMINGFVYSIMAGQPIPMTQNPSQQQSMVQDEAQLPPGQ